MAEDAQRLLSVTTMLLNLNYIVIRVISCVYAVIVGPELKHSEVSVHRL